MKIWISRLVIVYTYFYFVVDYIAKYQKICQKIPICLKKCLQTFGFLKCSWKFPCYSAISLKNQLWFILADMILSFCGSNNVFYSSNIFFDLPRTEKRGKEQIEILISKSRWTTLFLFLFYLLANTCFIWNFLPFANSDFAYTNVEE